MPQVKANSVKLNYELEGQGPPLVLINGLTMTLSGWAYQIKPFSERYTLIRYDCRGQGGSEKPDEEYSQEMHADDLSCLLDKLDVDRAHIVGLSNGGMIAQHFALRYPEKTGALVLVDTSSYIGKLLELTIQSWIKATEAGGNELRYDVFLPQIFSESYITNNEEQIMGMKEYSAEINSPAAVINLARASMKHDVTNRLSEIKSPTLIVVGEEDILVPPKYSHVLKSNIQDSELRVIEGSGHVPPLEKPDEFNSIVLEFLKRHDSII